MNIFLKKLFKTETHYLKNRYLYPDTQKEIYIRFSS